MPINVSRISRDIEIIAGFSESEPAIGHSRPTFSKSWRLARDYIIAQAEAAGCKTRIDAFGNVHARPEKMDWAGRAWLSGSHIDSVPTGGKYDGVAGIVCPLEVLRSAHESDQTIPLELIVFAEEEGTTFGLGMIGSRLWTGDATADSIAKFLNSNAQNFMHAGESHGVRPTEFFTDRFNSSHYRGFVEIHIEQGPAMWATQTPVAVVTAISGRKQFKAKFKGTPNHAGSTPMEYRADPLVAAAKVITAVDSIARQSGPAAVATVGRIECDPNAVNVIPGTVQFTVDLRSPYAAVLADCHAKIEQFVIHSSGVGEFNFGLTEDQPPVAMDAPLCDRLRKAAGDAGQTVSGALHDAAILAPHVPTAMLFVASRDGISHNPAEFSRIEDIAAAANILEKLVTEH